jgi:hypothetical protein
MTGSRWLLVDPGMRRLCGPDVRNEPATLTPRRLGQRPVGHHSVHSSLSCLHRGSRPSGDWYVGDTRLEAVTALVHLADLPALTPTPTTHPRELHATTVRTGVRRRQG